MRRVIGSPTSETKDRPLYVPFLQDAFCPLPLRRLSCFIQLLPVGSLEEVVGRGRHLSDEQGTVPKDCSAFSESASEPVGPPEICSPTLPPADKDVQIAVRAFLQDAFSLGQLIKCQILKLAVRIFPETRRAEEYHGVTSRGRIGPFYRNCCMRLYNKMPLLTRPRESGGSWTPEDAGGIFVDETRRTVIKRVQQTEGPLALSVYQNRCLRLLTRYLLQWDSNPRPGVCVRR